MHPRCDRSRFCHCGKCRPPAVHAARPAGEVALHVLEVAALVCNAMALATVAFFRRSTSLHAFGRSMGPDEVFKVMALTTISILLVLTGIFIMSIKHDGEFIDLAFEATSAFGTVGLSRGATAELDSTGRAMIMLMMFLGRVGPLTIGFFLATQSVPRVRYPEGKVYLG